MKKILLATLLLALLAGCSKNKFDAGEYVSYQPGNSYTYTGTMTVYVDSAKKTAAGIEYLVTDLDQEGQPLSREIYLKKDGKAYWKEFDGGGMNIPVYQFDPPMLSSPFSNKVGDKHSEDGIEIRQDGSRLRFRLEAEVLAVEDITTPAGSFKDCIKIRSAYSYLDTTSSPLISGEASRWFARTVGIVKYEMTNGVGELLGAKIGDRLFPAAKK